MHFPNLKFLNFEVLKADLGYEPSEFGRIEAAARQCVGAEKLGLSRCAVSADLAGRLVRTLRSSITRLYLGDAIISQPTLLQLAAGLEALREIVFPNEFSGSPEFFTSLARARPSLAELDFGEESTFDDACVAAMCENLKLEALTINQRQCHADPCCGRHYLAESDRREPIRRILPLYRRFHIGGDPAPRARLSAFGKGNMVCDWPDPPRCRMARGYPPRQER